VRPDDDLPRDPFGMTDEELAAQLRATQCEGLLWELVIALWEPFAERTLHALILNGQINARLKRLLRRAGPRLYDDEQLRLSNHPAEREELVAEAVADGLIHMRKHGLLGRKWSPEGGATLTTYFVNTVVLCLPSALRRWRSTRGGPLIAWHDDLADLEAAGLLPTPRTDDAEDAAVELLDQTITEMLYPLSEIVQQWRLRPDDGFAEAARRCGIARSTAYRLLQTYREERLRRPPRVQHRDPEDQS